MKANPLIKQCKLQLELLNNEIYKIKPRNLKGLDKEDIHRLAKYYPQNMFTIYRDLISPTKSEIFGNKSLVNNLIVDFKQEHSLTHPDHQYIYQFINAKLYADGLSLTSSWEGNTLIELRSIKNLDNNYYLYSVSKTPYLSVDNKTVSYLTWYSLITEYNGHPYYFDLKPINKENKSAYNKLTKDYLNNQIINSLPFTDAQMDILLNYSKGLSSKELAQNKGISQRTLDLHRMNILKKFRTVFSESKAENIKDIINYLHAMGIL